MSEVFRPDEYSVCYPEGIEHNFWNIARNALVQKLLRPLVSGADLVLDVGCGPGIFLNSIAGTGIEARGVEMAEACLSNE